MTSMPASRRARAITLAPRSWPSSPGLATSTRILRSVDIWVRFYQTSPQRHVGTEASTEETISGSCLAMAWRFQAQDRGNPASGCCVLLDSQLCGAGRKRRQLRSTLASDHPITCDPASRDLPISPTGLMPHGSQREPVGPPCQLSSGPLLHGTPDREA